LILNAKRKNFYFLKQTYLTLILLPVTLLTAFAINFDKAFVVFHEIFFRNNYWQFDPQMDPIINILPEEFFYHSALLIVILIILSIILLRVLYKHLVLKK
jgi:integral membrane protein (TIGR01906 family)